MSVRTYTTHAIVTGWNSLPEETFVRQLDYDALGEKHREMAIIWCKDEARHIRDRELARMEADKYKAALQMIVKLFENEDFMDESSDILDVLEIAERALK